MTEMQIKSKTVERYGKDRGEIFDRWEEILDKMIIKRDYGAHSKLNDKM